MPGTGAAPRKMRIQGAMISANASAPKRVRPAASERMASNRGRALGAPLAASR
ncbi:hypothetical protein C7S16_2556 [Burkholderia thailandensis]|uniref:Uncharacterized protein n=1 Tax=Burkholderia thailandensis TaxID=57975 RepID=A0AAW9CYX7_BURTH|nr:hypothetical protein [Burkholderia thailandensis]MDW9255800.1 hypothetical protein [Burkholderia thailandensis]